MKNKAIFFIACLITAGLIYISNSIADPELGISTVILIWGITLWYFINRQRSTEHNEPN